MANPSLQTELAHFEAQLQRHKNRLVAIPAAVQRRLGLQRRANNHLVYVSIRPLHSGRWNHHYFKLTCDNEFSIPADVTHLRPGDAIEVKIRQVIPDVSAPVGTNAPTAADVLLELMERPRPSSGRADGAQNHDEYLRQEFRS